MGCHEKTGLLSLLPAGYTPWCSIDAFVGVGVCAFFLPVFVCHG